MPQCPTRNCLTNPNLITMYGPDRGEVALELGVMGLLLGRGNLLTWSFKASPEVRWGRYMKPVMQILCDGITGYRDIWLNVTSGYVCEGVCRWKQLLNWWTQWGGWSSPLWVGITQSAESLFRTKGGGRRNSALPACCLSCNIAWCSWSSGRWPWPESPHWLSYVSILGLASLYNCMSQFCIFLHTYLLLVLFLWRSLRLRM